MPSRSACNHVVGALPALKRLVTDVGSLQEGLVERVAPKSGLTCGTVGALSALVDVACRALAPVAVTVYLLG